MYVIDHDKWTDDVFKQAIKFRIVVCHSLRNRREAYHVNFSIALNVALFATKLKKPVLLYAVTDYQTVLLPDKDWQHFLELWEEKTRVDISIKRIHLDC
jgi:hypothetical protein